VLVKLGQICQTDELETFDRVTRVRLCSVGHFWRGYCCVRVLLVVSWWQTAAASRKYEKKKAGRFV